MGVALLVLQTDSESDEHTRRPEKRRRVKTFCRMDSGDSDGIRRNQKGSFFGTRIFCAPKTKPYDLILKVRWTGPAGGFHSFDKCTQCAEWNIAVAPRP